MSTNIVKPLLLLTFVLLLSACSVAKLEARLEANPQCKEVVNPKTGALMPCPGSDKAFYAAAGLAPAKTQTPSSNTTTDTASAINSSAPSASDPQMPSKNQAAAPVAKPIEQPVVPCKPQIHKKSGGTLPCPAPD